MDSARQLLDELMGRNRNIDPKSGKAKELHWEDEENCIFYLVSFCPHECFINTKADLGSCRKIHDEAIKKQYDEAEFCPSKKRYEDEFLRFMNTMINDVERKIQKGKQRLLQHKGDSPPHQPMLSKVQEQINKMNDRIKRLVTEAEEAGLRGDVDQAQDLMSLCDKLKDEREALMKNHDKSQWSAELSQEKLMEVCEVCGAFLIVGDAQQRIEDHLTGKQHLGYAKLRRAVEDLYDRRRKRAGGADIEGGSRSGGGGDRRRRGGVGGGYEGERKSSSSSSSSHRNGGDLDRRHRYDRKDRDGPYNRSAGGSGGGSHNHRNRNRDRDNRRRSRSRS